MISNKSFTREWLESFINPKAKKKIQPDLLEKMIHALALLEKLAQQDIDYIFKGGTCLTLLLESANRFSIDVDITTPVAKEEFEKVLEDTFQTALIIARRGKNIGKDKGKFKELFEGIIKFNTFLIDGYFRIEQAQSASARVAYLASKLQNKDYSDLKVYSPDIDLSEMEIKNISYHFLNRFKRINREAFYYWHQCLSVRGLLEKG